MGTGIVNKHYGQAAWFGRVQDRGSEVGVWSGGRIVHAKVQTV
jgi:hypothetical protein